MLRKDRERDAAFAWEVFQKAPYATLSLTDEVGKPYAIPISTVVEERQIRLVKKLIAIKTLGWIQRRSESGGKQNNVYTLN